MLTCNPDSFLFYFRKIDSQKHLGYELRDAQLTFAVMLLPKSFVSINNRFIVMTALVSFVWCDQQYNVTEMECQAIDQHDSLRRNNLPGVCAQYLHQLT